MNNGANGLSLSLTVSAANFAGHHGDPTSLTVTLLNGNGTRARIAQLQVVQGHISLNDSPYGGGRRYEKNNLRYSQELRYVLRFPDGVVVVVPHSCLGIVPTSMRSDGSTWRYGPLEVPGGGQVSFTAKLLGAVFNSDYALNRAFRRCKSFGLTVVAEELGLRSNTVFLNGELPLPANFDPVAEVRKARQAAEDRIEAERRQGEVDFRRLLQQEGELP